MKQLLLQKFDQDCGQFTVQERPSLTPESDQVLIQVKYSGVNFADILAGKGLYQATPQLPCVIGYEICGTVTQIGKFVTDFKVGDRVITFTRFGGYTSELATTTEGLIRLPDSITDQQACQLLAQGCTALYGAHFLANVQPGETCLVQSITGGVGQVLAKLLVAKGCTVIGVTTSTEKLAFIHELGANPVLVESPADYREVFQRHSIQVIFDCYGGKYFKIGYHALKAGGRIVTYGAASRNGAAKGIIGTLQLLFGFGWIFSLGLLAGSKSILGLNMLKVGDENPKLLQQVMLEVFQSAENGLIPIQPDRIFPAQQVRQAHQYIDRKKSRGKVLLDWSRE